MQPFDNREGKNTMRSSAAAPSPSNSPPRGRLWLRIVVIAAVVVVVGLSALPWLASTLLRSTIVGAVDGRLSGSLTIESLRLSWLGGQTLRNIELRDPDGAPVLRIDRITTEASLLNLAFGGLAFGTTVIDSMEAVIVADASGQTNLQRALGGYGSTAKAGKSAPKARVPASLSGSIMITNASVSTSMAGGAPVGFEDMQLTARLPKLGEPLEFLLQARAAQGELDGKIDAKGTIAGIFDAQGVFTPSAMQPQITATAVDLPVDGLDTLAGSAGALRAALGNTLNVELFAAPTADGASATLRVEAPQLRAAFVLRSDGKTLALTEPGGVEATVTDALLQSFLPADKGRGTMHLVGSAPMRLQVARLELPVSPLKPDAMGLEVSFTLGELTLRGGEAIGEIKVRKLRGDVDVTRLADGVRFTLAGETEQAGQRGGLDVKGEINNALNEDGDLDLDGIQVNIDAKIADLPLGPIDAFAGRKGMLVAALGARATIDAGAVSRPGGVDVRLGVRAPRLNIDLPLAVGETVTLTAPAKGRFTLTPALLNGGKTPIEGVRLAADAPLDFSIESFTLPLPKGKEPPRMQDVVLNATVSGQSMRLLGISESALTVTGLTADIRGDSLKQVRVNAGATLEDESKDGVIALTAGGPLKLALRAEAGIDSDGAFRTEQVTLETESKLLTTKLRGQYGEAFVLSDPADISLVLTPALLKGLGAIKDPSLTLAGPTPLRLRVQSMVVPLKDKDMGPLKVAAGGEIAEVKFASGSPLADWTLNGLRLDIKADGQANTATLGITGQTKAAGKSEPSPLHADVKVKSFLDKGAVNWRGAEIHATSALDGVPTALIDALAGLDGRLPPAIGSAADVTLGYSQNAGRSGDLDVQVKAEHLTLAAVGQVTEFVALSKPMTVEWTITPAGWAVLNKPAKDAKAKPKAPPVLDEPAKTVIVVKSLRWPLPSKDKPADYTKAALTADLKVPRLALTDKSAGLTTRVDNLVGTVSSADLTGDIAVDLRGNGTTSRIGQAPPGEPGKIAVVGTVSRLFTREGKFNQTGVAVDLDITLDQLPSQVVDNAAGMEGQIHAICGDTMNVRSKVVWNDMTGPFSMDLDASNARSKLAADLGRKVLILREPYHATVGVTPLLGQKVLGRYSSFLAGVIDSDKPIDIHVAKDGFEVPFAPFAWEGVQVPHARIETGALTLKNEGAIATLRAFAGPNAGKTLRATISPIVGKVAAGVIALERVDVNVADALRFGVWGKIDMVREFVDMQVELPSETLANTVGLVGLSPNTSVRLPLRGPFGGVKVDYTAVASQLPLMAAQQPIDRTMQGLGSVLGALTGGAVNLPGTGAGTSAPTGASSGAEIPGEAAAPSITEKITRTVTNPLGGILGGGKKAAQPEVKSEAQPATDPAPAAKTEPKKATQPEPVATPVAEPQPETETMAEPRSEPEPEAESAPEAEAESEAAEEPKAETQPAVTPATKKDEPVNPLKKAADGLLGGLKRK